MDRQPVLAEDMIVPGFENIIGQKIPLQLLQSFLRSARLPHALLFTGIEGIGKRSAAKAVAMSLNCRNPENPVKPCGQCPPCRQIVSDRHPDVLTIEPQGSYLRIYQIRNLLATLSMKPHSAEYRVIIIANAQAMNNEAANALLKVLEEPPFDTTLILTSEQQSDLLPTIVSRCRHIRFHPLSANDIVTLLQRVKEVDTDFVETAAALSGGSLTKAKQLATDYWRRQRDWLIRAAGMDQPMGKDRRSVVSALAFAAQLAQKKERITELLEILKTWVRDLSIWPYYPESVINSDYGHVLTRVRSGMDDQRLLALWQAIDKAGKDIAAKANVRLALDTMALGMAGYELG